MKLYSTINKAGEMEYYAANSYVEFLEEVIKENMQSFEETKEEAIDGLKYYEMESYDDYDIVKIFDDNRIGTMMLAHEVLDKYPGEVGIVGFFRDMFS